MGCEEHIMILAFWSFSSYPLHPTVPDPIANYRHSCPPHFPLSSLRLVIIMLPDPPYGWIRMTDLTSKSSRRLGRPSKVWCSRKPRSLSNQGKACQGYHTISGTSTSTPIFPGTPRLRRETLTRMVPWRIETARRSPGIPGVFMVQRNRSQNCHSSSTPIPSERPRLIMEKNLYPYHQQRDTRQKGLQATTSLVCASWESDFGKHTSKTINRWLQRKRKKETPMFGAENADGIMEISKVEQLSKRRGSVYMWWVVVVEVVYIDRRHCYQKILIRDV
jgi:hypothetical protein